MNVADPSRALMFSIQILQRDKGSQEKAPKVLQEELNTAAPKGSRQFSTSARRAWNAPARISEPPSGHLFELPSLPLPKDAVRKHRYDPMIKQFANLMMRDGKLSKAQRVRPSVSLIFDVQLLMMRLHCLYADTICGGRTLL